MRIAFLIFEVVYLGKNNALQDLLRGREYGLFGVIKIAKNHVLLILEPIFNLIGSPAPA